jgi:hypothetical protein
MRIDEHATDGAVPQMQGYETNDDLAMIFQWQ